MSQGQRLETKSAPGNRVSAGKPSQRCSIESAPFFRVSAVLPSQRRSSESASILPSQRRSSESAPFFRVSAVLPSPRRSSESASFLRVSAVLTSQRRRQRSRVSAPRVCQRRESQHLKLVISRNKRILSFSIRQHVSASTQDGVVATEPFFIAISVVLITQLAV